MASKRALAVGIATGAAAVGALLIRARRHRIGRAETGTHATMTDPIGDNRVAESILQSGGRKDTVKPSRSGRERQRT
ncbi:hypothetical protein ACFQZ4_04045 [Catellatospora coxensis]|uniref:Uncharacterized protein n=1 Tax=Catellatospora coxensis TaxID=310354 RepID=A0A8J3L4P7_9ACTN|nr:hypothetical protein Cco03nite_31650 [Catellatospora coxensis]